jgi:hypothetical protein
MHLVKQHRHSISSTRVNTRAETSLFMRSTIILLAVTLLCALPLASSAQTNGVLRQIYSGLSGSTLQSLTNNSSFPNDPTIRL